MTRKSLYDRLCDFISICGPGMIMMTNFLDPGNVSADYDIASDSGTRNLFVPLFAGLFGLLIQLLTLRAALIPKYYSEQENEDEDSDDLFERIGHLQGMSGGAMCHRILLFLLIEATLLASGIQEVIGTSLALNALIPQMPAFFAPYCNLLLTLIIVVSLHWKCHGYSYLSVLLLVLLMAGVLAISVISFPSASLRGIYEINKGNFDNSSLRQILAMIGSLTMPQTVLYVTNVITTKQYPRFNRRERSTVFCYHSIEFAIAIAFGISLNIAMMINFSYLVNTDLRIQVHYSTRVIWGLGLLASGFSSTLSLTLLGQQINQLILRDKDDKKFRLKFKVRAIFNRIINALPLILAAFFLKDRYIHATGVISQYCNIIMTFGVPFVFVPILKINKPKNCDCCSKNCVYNACYYFLAVFILSIFASYPIIQILPTGEDKNIDIDNAGFWIYILFFAVPYYCILIFLYFKEYNVDTNKKELLDHKTKIFRGRWADSTHK